MQKIFLLGDAGEPEPNDPVLRVLNKELLGSDVNDLLLILGDNIYPGGLSPQHSSTRKEEEQKLKQVLDVAKGFRGKTILIPGNHDWGEMRETGWENIMNQQEYVRQHYPSVSFLPQGALPGPAVMALSDSTSLIVIDFQWFIHKWKKPMLTDGGMQLNLSLFLKKLDETLLGEAGKLKLVACHHPMLSYGDHGKALPFRDFIYPFGASLSSAFLPQPGFGYLFPFSRQLKGEYQDIAHPRYRYVRNQLMKVLKKHSPLLFVSGHDHSFQHLVQDGNQFIICGSASKSGKVYKGEKALYVSNQKGFGTIAIKEQKVELAFLTVKGERAEPAYLTSAEFPQVPKKEKPGVLLNV